MDSEPLRRADDFAAASVGRGETTASSAEDRARRRLVALAGWTGFFAVLIGAFGAHGLEDWLTSRFAAPAELIAKRLDQFDVGARYHLAHAVALLAISGWSGGPRKPLRRAAWLMFAGIVLFSGSLYVLVLTNTPGWGAVTPIGGVLWLVAWGLVAVSARRAG
jgi:uncharacterized membrane protein YgdD (TMEM256/DUF423 family)